MIYHGTEVVESIAVRPMEDMDVKHYINMVKMSDEARFYVDCCCNPDWFYDFKMENNSDYERIKFCIMENIFKCETMDELLYTLGEAFEAGFDDILIKDVCECNGDCANCRHE